MSSTLIILIAVVSILVICLAIANSAEGMFRKRYEKYSGMITNVSITAGEFTSRLVMDSGYKNLKLAYTEKELEDAFSSKHNAIILSTKTIHSYSIAGYATAVHEFGHAVQHNSGQISYKILKVLKFLTYTFGNFSFPLVIAGLVMTLINAINTELAYGLIVAGAVIFLISLFTQLLTIPIEYGASNIGLNKLKEYDLLNAKELKMAKRFLKSAGLTYVAAFLSRILAWTFLVPKYKH